MSVMSDSSGTPVIDIVKDAQIAVNQHTHNVKNNLTTFIEHLKSGFENAKITYLEMCVQLKKAEEEDKFDYEFYLKIYIYINIIIDLLKTIKEHIINLNGEGGEFNLDTYKYTESTLKTEFENFNSILNINDKDYKKIIINELYDQIWSAAKNIDIFKNNNNTSPPPGGG